MQPHNPAPPPPPGGYGGGYPGQGHPGQGYPGQGYPGAQGFGPAYPPAPKSSGAGRTIAIVAIVLGVVFAFVSILGVLAVYGVRKYIANAKTMEARNTLGQLGKDAAMAYEGEGEAAPSNSPGAHRVCPSASQAVPLDATQISGKKYQSSPAEWQVDQGREGGFACLGFVMGPPQYFQYRYEATTSSFTAGARGDLDGNGRFSDFALVGKVQGGRLLLAPSIAETDPFE